MGSGARLRIGGRMPEKFLAAAMEAGVRIRDCRRLDAGLTEVHVPRRDAPKVENLARKYHLPCENMGCDGAASLAERLLRRRTVVIGVLALLGVSALLLSRVWLVQVLPADDTDAAVLQQVAQVLADYGAQPGASLWKLDRAFLRSRIISEVPQAGYVSVKRRGVCIVAEVSQAIEPPSTYDIGAARDVAAMYDGVVQRVDVYAGTAAVQPGDIVRRGDVLIRGEERISKEEVVPVAADGAVIARIWQSAEVRQSVTETALVPTGQVSEGETLVIGPWQLPVAQAETYAHQTVRQTFLPVGGMFVPVGILRITHEECVQQIQNRDEAAVKRLLLEEAEAILDKNMPFRAIVVDKWQDYSMISSGELYMKLTRELEADIAASGRAE